nr:hypothetical protein BaRGS_002302 [Batillaria attramentaria]
MAIVGDNYAVISKTDDPGLREREIQRLLRKIDDVSDYGRTYFTNKELKRIEDAVNKQVNDIAAKENIPRKEANLKVTRETLTGEKTSVDQFCQNYPKECWLNQIINKHQGYNRLFPAKIFAWAVGGG